MPEKEKHYDIMIKNKKGSWPVNEENKKIECWVRGFQEFAKRRHPHAKAVLPVFFHIAYCLKAGQSSTCLFSQILQSISFYFIISGQLRRNQWTN
jgi:hypothetical protein